MFLPYLGRANEILNMLKQLATPAWIFSHQIAYYNSNFEKHYLEVFVLPLRL